MTKLCKNSICKSFSIKCLCDHRKIISLACRYRNDVPVLDKFGANGVSIFSFQTHAFADRIFTLMLVYRK